MIKAELLRQLENVTEDARIAIRLNDGSIVDIGDVQWMKRTPGFWKDDELHLNMVAP